MFDQFFLAVLLRTMKDHGFAEDTPKNGCSGHIHRPKYLPQIKGSTFLVQTKLLSQPAEYFHKAPHPSINLSLLIARSSTPFLDRTSCILNTTRVFCLERLLDIHLPPCPLPTSINNPPSRIEGVPVTTYIPINSYGLTLQRSELDA